MIFGIGIDIIEVDRIRKQIEKGERFKERIFTDKEQQYCEPKRNKAQNYAARFAAKEAFFKAIGTGWRGGITFKDVEIVNNEAGKPEIFLYGKAREFVKENELKNIQVSLSHIKNFASAIVAVEK
jgi:holo-[acyl-carrier protein] synthase